MKHVLEQHRIRPKRELGQNFIRSDTLAQRFIENAQIQPDDTVIEVGPGLGILTKKILKKTNKVFAVEKDTQLFKLLKEQYKNNNLILLNKDILEVKPRDLCQPAKHCKIISNVPYPITSDFLYWIIEHRKYIANALLILQKEVVERLIAGTETKAYGSLSVFFQALTDIKLLFRIPGTAFYPPTNVLSTVVSITPTKTKIKNEELFFKVVKLAFTHRRKQLSNSLSSILPKTINYEPLTTNLSIDLSRRPETLDYKEFIQLSSELKI